MHAMLGVARAIIYYQKERDSFLILRVFFAKILSRFRCAEGAFIAKCDVSNSTRDRS
jgi:hypothetical protein